MVGLIAATALAVSSQITDVTVYNDRAQVTRTAQVDLEPGVNTLVFDDLPEAIDSRGIQVEGTGDATVLDVRYKTENFKDIPSAAWKELYDRRDALQDEEQIVNQRIARLHEQKGFLAKISQKVTHQAETENELQLDPDSWDKMLSLYTDKGAEYDKALQEAEQELKGVRKELEKVLSDIRDAGADTHKQRRIVEVDVDAAKAGQAELRLSYLVAGPGWNPIYDVRVDTKTREMVVQYFALVQQNTGEDWGDVSLKLSTANPGLGGQHPDLEPWRIAIRAPLERGKLYGSIDALSDGADKSVSSLEKVPAMLNAFATDELQSARAAGGEPVMALPSSVRQQGVSVLFEVKGSSTVDSDNVEHRVAISSTPLPAHFRYSAVPKLDKHAYLKAKAVNESDSPFLAGKANVFLDGSYVATSSLELVAPGEEFWVFLGADETMKVEYKLIKKFISHEGLTGHTVRHTYEYQLSVENTHDVAEEVLVWDQLPISANEAIEVKLDEPRYSKDNDALKIDEEKRIQWFKTLDAGQKWEIPLKFRVEAPKDIKIAGLE